MAQLFSGECLGRVVNPEAGRDQNQRARVRWEMEVTEGEHKGKRASYSGKLDPENIRWTKRDMKTIGWKGESISTFVADVKAANLIVPFTAEIASHERDGKVSEWTSAKFGGALPLTALDQDKIQELDQWFAEAEDVQPIANASTDPIPF
jgi:hypothetical protein